MRGCTAYFRYNDSPGWVTIDAAPSAANVRSVLACLNVYFAHVPRAWADVLGVDTVANELRPWMEVPPSGSPQT